MEYRRAATYYFEIEKDFGFVVGGEKNGRDHFRKTQMKSILNFEREVQLRKHITNFSSCKVEFVIRVSISSSHPLCASADIRQSGRTKDIERARCIAIASMHVCTCFSSSSNQVVYSRYWTRSVLVLKIRLIFVIHYMVQGSYKYLRTVDKECNRP